MNWITIRTTSSRWEAEFLGEILSANEIPNRILDLGVASYLGMGSPAALQVPLQHRWTALLLLSPSEAEEQDPNL
ncbi:hypothetical protein NG798_06165 [Ancylothrix sp. C2]|uniref:hypothetical protein n=1 Tax=Ancylothrix sp. D3o TaxID=2953691 RepID=UPI0021BB65FB|nr:hypothetical protein [Ancylothrix sp. D3o]MCT7949365.1 hypothetical protein [Ancylothrix sp. D3o]